MDFKKFGLIILLLGVFVLAYGAIEFGVNQPKVFDKSESKPFILGGFNDLDNMMNVMNINEERGQKRKQASTIMIAGVIVGIIGIGVRFSVKK